MSLREKYPEAFEDEHGTIWTSQTAAESADWTYEHGDGFLDEVLGYSWAEAEENFNSCQIRDRKRAFWRAHPLLRDGVWFAWRWYRRLSMFATTVGREWYEVRITPALAWELSGIVWGKR